MGESRGGEGRSEATTEANLLSYCVQALLDSGYEIDWMATEISLDPDGVDTIVLRPSGGGASSGGSVSRPADAVDRSLSPTGTPRAREGS